MQSPIPYNDVTFVLLAGGRSQRMGTDKGMLPLNKTTFSEQLITVAKNLTSRIVVSVGGHNASSYPNLMAIEDIHSEKGPMGGIISVLPHIKTNWFFLVSVDAPLVSTSVLSELWDNKDGYEAIVFGDNNRFHPLIGLYNINTKNNWEEAFNKGNLKVTSLVKGFNLRVIDARKETISLLKNINTPMEYKELTDL